MYYHIFRRKHQIINNKVKKNLLNRPKLQQGRLEENLKQMYKNRIIDYRRCDFTIDVNETSTNEIVSQIIKKLKKYDQFNSL